jgi:hypothetical protein
MWRKRKWIIAAVLAVVILLAGSIGSVALAQTGSTSDGSGKTLLARVAAILGIDQQKLEEAFAQAQKEMRDEALDNQLKGLVEKGNITQEQADQYKQWWQSRPDMEQYRQQLREWQKARPDIPSEWKQWQEERPDIPLPKGFGGHGFRGGMKWGKGCYQWGWPNPTP